MVSTIHDKVTSYFTDQKYGKSPLLRSISELLELGVINLNKPANPTSHEVSAWIKQILKISKAGHGGTLDPAVTGCLPVALGRATRALQVLLPAGKEYICIIKTHQPVSQEKLLKVLDDFRGKIYQTPPVRSNVKRRLRVRKIYELELKEHDGSHLALLRIKCQAGTYIRKLAHDIGLLLGSGAHMQELRRSKSGPFFEDESVTLQEVRDAWHYYTKEGNEEPLREIIRPIEEICVNMPKIYIRDSAVNAICHGAALTLPGVVKITNGVEINSLVTIFTLKEELVAFGTSTMTTKQVLDSTNGICVHPHTVFMEKNIYPSTWKKK